MLPRQYALMIYLHSLIRISNRFDDSKLTCRHDRSPLEGPSAKCKSEIRELAKKMTRRVWTKDDVRTLKAMAKAKAGTASIAKSLKRTTAATAVKAASLGVSLSTR
jgi:hypothetical protein